MDYIFAKDLSGEMLSPDVAQMRIVAGNSAKIIRKIESDK